MPGLAPGRVATFIAADTEARRLDLGSDGKLPELRLEETQSAKSDASQSGSSPWLLIGVLAFSILSSIAMLLIDAGATGRDATSKEDARLEIQRVYLNTGDSVFAKPFEQRLRQALLAHSRGDWDEESRYYREVSQMLRADNLHPLRGLTGDISSDSRLSELLATLLRD